MLYTVTIKGFIKVADNVCFNAVGYFTGYEFSPPYNGVIDGVKLVHTNGGVTCSSSAATNWGCGADLLFVNVINGHSS